MATRIINNLILLFNNANLVPYEQKVLFSLYNSGSGLKFTAKEISTNSKVPIGRIYEILENLVKYGMLELSNSRPKKYSINPLNRAVSNLIKYKSMANRQTTKILVKQATEIEKLISESDDWEDYKGKQIYWSTYSTKQDISELYYNLSSNTFQEMLFIDFINPTTTKIYPKLKKYYPYIKTALQRGVKIKVLWCFEFDFRPLSDKDEIFIKDTIEEMKIIHKRDLDLPLPTDGYEVRFLNRTIHMKYDIFDQSRVILKMQNPLKSYHIFTCMSMYNPELALDLRKKFLNIWEFQAEKLF